MLNLQRVSRTYPTLLTAMANHYSAPKGFVGRNLCYEVLFNEISYGFIVGGSATLHLPGRDEFLKIDSSKLNSVINNIFFHVEKVDNKYPVRNFTEKVLLLFEKVVLEDWKERYKDSVIGFESLVELPRTGEIYLRSGYTEVGMTKGYTCKRVAGKSTDSYTGRRVWDTVNLRPKRVFCKKVIEGYDGD